MTSAEGNTDKYILASNYLADEIDQMKAEIAEAAITAFERGTPKEQVADLLGGYCRRVVALRAAQEILRPLAFPVSDECPF